MPLWGHLLIVVEVQIGQVLPCWTQGSHLSFRISLQVNGRGLISVICINHFHRASCTFQRCAEDQGEREVVPEIAPTSSTFTSTM